MVQQALVDRAELLDVQLGIVDLAVRAGVFVVVVDEVGERLEELPVADELLLQLDRLEQASVQHGESQQARERLSPGLRHRSVVSQEVPEDVEGQPQILVVGIRLPAVHQPAEASHAVVFPVQVGASQKLPFFRYEQEQEPVHEP